MFKNTSPRLFFSMAAIAMLIISPFFAIIMPIILIETFFTHDDTKLYIYPFMTSTLVIVFAFVLFAVACLLLFWKREKVTFLLSTLIVLGGIYTLYSTSQMYTVIDSEQIVVKNIWSEKSVEWADMSEVALEYVSGDLGDYVFKMADGQEFILKENKSHVTSYIYNLANAKSIPFVERAKE
ncbi:ATP-dependent exonuclease [Solibacillus sp. R5-41]|uniref:ATP-dependent exonuclease n=1 Tax=Solibacillus sp. R5-41 TaxID=2048654 RepID=UPI000C124FD3|nr:ATP-dependent exonuclease [Solibacillus sp. R5-41]ATP39878.1 ATP-dependent exonuclease [Solibacillus sp. R5-41]